MFQNTCWDEKVTPFVDKKPMSMEEEVELCKCCTCCDIAKGKFDVVEGYTNFIVKLRDHSCDYKR